MAKTYYLIFIVLFLYSCSPGSDSSNGIIRQKDSTGVDLQVQSTDEPVIVDTVYADTARFSLVPKTIEEVIPEKRLPTVIETASRYIGVREKTGNNDGKEVEYFLSNVGLGKGFSWCAAFVKTCLIESGHESAHIINGMALSCENKRNMVYKSGMLLKELQPGDVFTLYYPHLKRIGHTGFYEKPFNSKFYISIEGNTNSEGSREGDGVYRKRRSYNATFSISRWN